MGFFGKTGQEYMALGMKAYLEKDMVTAVKYLRKSIDLDPKQAVLHQFLAGALMQLGDLDSALTHCSEAVRLRPDYPSFRQTYGVILTKKERYEEAIEHFRIAIKLCPETTESNPEMDERMRVLGGLYPQSSQMLTAPGSIKSEIHTLIGGSLFYLGRFQEAEEEYKKAIEVDPNAGPAHDMFGKFLYNTGREYESFEFLKESIKKIPTYIQLRVTFSVLLSTKAEQLRNEAFGTDTKKMREAGRLMKENLEVVEEAAKLDPNLRDALEELKLIYKSDYA